MVKVAESKVVILFIQINSTFFFFFFLPSLTQ